MRDTLAITRETEETTVTSWWVWSGHWGRGYNVKNLLPTGHPEAIFLMTHMTEQARAQTFWGPSAQTKTKGHPSPKRFMKLKIIIEKKLNK